MAKFRVSDGDFQIDANNLDVEWTRQPDLYRQYATAAADARQGWDEAKNDVSVVRAQVEKDVRTNPADHGLAKVTEGAIKGALDIDSRVREAEEALIEARHRYDVLNAACEALDHKKTALSKLVDLHLADYFSKPSAPPGYRDNADDAGKTRTRKSQRRGGTNDDD